MVMWKQGRLRKWDAQAGFALQIQEILQGPEVCSCQPSPSERRREDSVFRGREWRDQPECGVDLAGKPTMSHLADPKTSGFSQKRMFGRRPSG